MRVRASSSRLPPLCRSLLEDDAFSTMAGLAGAEAEVSLACALLPTLSTDLWKQ